MPIFEYKATNTEGQTVTGTALGANLQAAVESLANRGLSVTAIAPAASAGDTLAEAPRENKPVETPRENRPVERSGMTEKPPQVDSEIEDPTPDARTYFQTDIAGPLIGQVPLRDLAFFFRQLGTMLNAGVGMFETLTTLSKQSRSGKLSGIIAEMARHAESGNPISAAMQRYPEVFTPLVLSMIRAGERGGMQDKIAEQLADYIEQEIELRRVISRALLWPKIILVSSVIIIIAANAVVAAYGITGSKTYIYSPLTDPVVWIWLTPVIIALFLFVRIGLHNNRMKFNWDHMVAVLPGFAANAQQFAMAKFGRAFGTLYKAGVNIPESIRLGADACGNEYIRSRIYPAVDQIKEGQPITDTLRETGIFNPIVLDMTNTGETTGNLDQMLLKMAEFYEAEAAQNSNRNAIVFGVVIYGIVAIYIAYIIIRFYMSLFGGMMKGA